jgi:hypothetical protein
MHVEAGQLACCECSFAVTILCFVNCTGLMLRVVTGNLHLPIDCKSGSSAAHTRNTQGNFWPCSIASQPATLDPTAHPTRLRAVAHGNFNCSRSTTVGLASCVNPLISYKIGLPPSSCTGAGRGAGPFAIGQIWSTGRRKQNCNHSMGSGDQRRSLVKQARRVTNVESKNW